MPDNSDSSSSSSSDESKAVTGEDSSPVSPSGSSDGVLVELPGTSDQDSRDLRVDPDSSIFVNIDGAVLEQQDDGGREESFEDASDQIGVASDRSVGLEESIAMIEIGETSGGRLVSEDFGRMQNRLEDMMAECRKHKEEREVFGREVVELRQQLRDIVRAQAIPLVRNNEAPDDRHKIDDQEERMLLSPTPLHSLLKDCSRFIVDLQGILKQKSNAENTMAELDQRNKEEEIVCSVQPLELDALKQSTDDAITRLLVSLETVAEEEHMSHEESPVDGMVQVEKRVSSLIARHTQLLFEIHQLGKCLQDVKPEFATSGANELTNVLVVAREAITRSRKNEVYLQETINKIEEENKKLTEQVERMTESLELASAEASKAKLELEQTESKLMATKEKLSLAVTKGKSLVQHRDSLKQSLAEKASEVERCMQELQQKSEAFQSLEFTVEELKQLLSKKTSDLETSMQELQQKSEVFQAMESSFEELKQVLSEKTIELENCLEELQQKTDALEATKATAEELTISESLATSLKESLSYKEKVLHDIEEVISEVKIPEDMGSLELVDKISWIVNQNSFADAIILEHQKIRKAISSITLPDNVALSELDSQASWLVCSLNQVKDDIATMRDKLRSAQLASESHEMELLEARKEIDHLKLSLVEETQAKICIQDEHEKLKNEHQEINEKFSIVSSEKDGLVKVLHELSGSIFDSETSVDTNIVKDKCMAKMRETMKHSDVGVVQLETMQRLLYLSFQESKLSERILEEEMVDRAEMLRLSDEVARLSKEAVSLKNDKDSIQKELERVEEKSLQIREKLSMAVKKGKGLVQEREQLKASLDEKTSNIEKLKQELQLKDSEIVEYHKQIKTLTAYEEQIRKLESDISTLLNERNQKEQSLQNSNRRLQEVADSVERIVLPVDATFEEPWDKVNWISEHVKQLVVEKDNAVQDLNKIKEEASLANNKLNDALATIKLLEDELSTTKQHIYFGTEEISGLKLHKESIEQEVEILKEENLQQASKLKEALSKIKYLEDALSNAEKNIANLSAERDQVEAKSKQQLSELNANLASCMEELALTRSNLENYTIDLNDQLGHLLLILKDDSLLSVMSKVLGKTTKGFRKICLIIHDLHDSLTSESDPKFAEVATFEGIEDLINKMAVSLKTTPIYSDGGPSLSTIMEELQAQAKFFCNVLEDYSRYLDSYIPNILQSLQTTGFKLAHLLDESRKVDINALQAENQAKEAKLVSLQEEIKEISSATMNATRELLIEIEESGNSGFDLEQNVTDSGLGRPNDTSSVAGEEVNHSNAARTAETLLLAVRRIKMYYQKHVKEGKTLLASKADIESRFKQAESVIQDQNVEQERVSTLLRDLEVLNKTCNEMKHKIEDYEAKEDMLRAKEEQFDSMQRALAALGIGNDQGQLENLVNKINQIKVPFIELQGWREEVDVSSPIEKLLYIVDRILDLQHRLEILSNEKEDLQLSLASYAREIEHLKATTKSKDSYYEELHSKKAELLEVTLGLEKTLQRLGGYDSVQDKKSVTAKMLLAILEKATTALSLESENSRSRIKELLAKLKGKDEVIDELCMKINMLEESIHAPTGQQVITKERPVFETAPATIGSDISEIEDVGSIAKNISSSGTSAHVRTMRKGSSDHLALNIDSEAERLIDSKEADVKGRVFKSLNASGLIPKQGKLVADKIDGIWVSGDLLLRNRPGARLGLVAYWIFLHLWLLGTIL